MPLADINRSAACRSSLICWLFMRKRSERHILQSLFISLTGAGGGEDDMREFSFHIIELVATDSRDRYQLGPCPVVCRRHGIQFIGTKEWIELLKGHSDHPIHALKFVQFCSRAA